MIDFSRLIKSFGHALRGVRHAFLYHQNLKIHSLALAIILLLGFLLRISYFKWIALLLAAFTVFAAEMINTALEEVINLVKEEHSERARIAKDVSAGMVLLAALFAVAVGAIVFLPLLK